MSERAYAKQSADAAKDDTQATAAQPDAGVVDAEFEEVKDEGKQ